MAIEVKLRLESIIDVIKLIRTKKTGGAGF